MQDHNTLLEKLLSNSDEDSGNELETQETPATRCTILIQYAKYCPKMACTLLFYDFIYQVLLKKIIATMIPNIIVTPFVYFFYDVLYKTASALKNPCQNIANYFNNPDNKQTGSWFTEISFVLLSCLLALGSALFSLGLLTLSSPEDILNTDYLTQLPHNPRHLISLIAGLVFFSYPSLKVNAIFARCFLTETVLNMIKNPFSLLGLVPGLIAGLPLFAIGFDDLDALHPIAGYALGSVSLLMFSVTRAAGLVTLVGGLLDGTFRRDNDRQQLNHEIKNLTPTEKEKLNRDIVTHSTQTNEKIIKFIQKKLKETSTYNSIYNIIKRTCLPLLMFVSVSIVFGFKGLGTLESLDKFFDSNIAPDDDDLPAQFGLASIIGCLSGIFYLMAAWRRELNDDTLLTLKKFQCNQPKKDKSWCIDALNTTEKSDPENPRPYHNSYILRLQILAIAPAILMSWNACKTISQDNNLVFWLAILSIGAIMPYGAFDINRQAYLKQTYRKELKAAENADSAQNGGAVDYVENIRRMVLLKKNCIDATQYRVNCGRLFEECCSKPPQRNRSDSSYNSLELEKSQTSTIDAVTARVLGGKQGQSLSF